MFFLFNCIGPVKLFSNKGYNDKKNLDLDNVIHECNPIDFFIEPLNTYESSKKTYLKTFLKTIFFLGHPVVICIYKMHKSAKVQLFSPPLPLLVCLKHPSGKRTWMKRSPTGTYRHQKRRFEEETGLV